jgi:hypothetical protein
VEQPGALVLNQVSGADDRWTDAQKLSLTYCVSTTFGSNYNAVVNAMANAAAAWMAAANVRFIYRSDQDGNWRRRGHARCGLAPSEHADKLVNLRIFPSSIPPPEMRAEAGANQHAYPLSLSGRAGRG